MTHINMKQEQDGGHNDSSSGPGKTILYVIIVLVICIVGMAGYNVYVSPEGVSVEQKPAEQVEEPLEPGGGE